MKIQLHRTDDALQMEAKNQAENKVVMDASAKAGGNDSGVSPMELVLSAVGGCSTIDILLILKKQRLNVEDVQVTVEGKRADAIPAVFTDIHVHYKIIGDVSIEKAERAVNLSLETYCSVSKMLENSVNITSSVEVANQ